MFMALCSARACRGRRRCPTGFTLVELLLTVAILGIAGALVIPSMTQTGVLRVQAAVRTVVADIAFVQADAMAYQTRRAIWFNRVPRADGGVWTYDVGNGYTVGEVSGASFDLATDALYHPDTPSRPFSRNFSEERFGGARINAVDFEGEELLIFDELGGPVADLTGPAVSVGGTINIQGQGVEYQIGVAPLTGRITIDEVDVSEDGGGGV